MEISNWAAAVKETLYTLVVCNKLRYQAKTCMVFVLFIVVMEYQDYG